MIDPTLHDCERCHMQPGSDTAPPPDHQPKGNPPTVTQTETIRWTQADGYTRLHELEDRLADDTPVTITAYGETHTTTTVYDGYVRYVRLPFGRSFSLSVADEWTAEVPVENPAPAWLDMVLDEGDELDDASGFRWHRTDDGDWRCVKLGTVLSAADLHRKHGPLTPIILGGKPAVAWADADGMALAVCRDRLAAARWTDDDDLRTNAGYDIAIATARALCTVYDEPEVDFDSYYAANYPDCDR